MKTGTRKRLRTALIATGLAGGCALVLFGAMAMYGTPGLALSNYLPISPAADRHPPTDRLLMDVRKSFQDYQNNAGRLYSAGQALMDKYELAYLRIESRGGVSIHRSYDAGRITFGNVQELEDRVAREAIIAREMAEAGARAPELGSFGRYYYKTFPVQILKGPELIEEVAITIAYEQIYVGGRRFSNLFGVPHSVSRLAYLRFDAAAPYIAGAAIIAGLAMVLLSLREPLARRARNKSRPRRLVFTDETWPDPNRPLSMNDDEQASHDAELYDETTADALHQSPSEAIDESDFSGGVEKSTEPAPSLSPAGERRFQILSDPANFVFQAPLNAHEEQSLRKKIAALEAEAGERDATRYEFEQERWNLPGFQSVMQPLRQKIQAEDLDFWPAAKGAGRGFDNQSSLFDFRYYRFHEQQGYPEQIADIESFARGFLTAVTDLATHATATLYLRNRRGRFHPTLRRSGSVFISGAALGSEPAAHHLVKQLEDGRYVVMEEGREIYFPVPCRQAPQGTPGVLGLICMKSDRPMYNAETLSAAWYEIRKFGESLFQARVFEEAVSDPESTLSNGLSFHRDLLHEYSLKREIKNGRMLILLRFRGRSNPDSGRLFGLGLRSFFAAPFRLYRVAADVFAALGPELPLEELERRLGEFLEFVREQEAVDVNAGCALLNDDGAGPASAYEWFRQAGTALEQSEKTGLNRLRQYDSVQSGAVVFRQFANRD
ncbi:MAG: hypothetical protein NXI24_02790 [bacterium]|nr:hypothetical protein [bacterium]